jgi:hypothetical protein
VGVEIALECEDTDFHGSADEGTCLVSLFKEVPPPPPTFY